MGVVTANVGAVVLAGVWALSVSDRFACLYVL